MNPEAGLARLVWYARRARGMSGPEVVHRLRERARIARVDPEASAPLALADRPTFALPALRELYAAAPGALVEIDATVGARQLRLLGHPLSLESPSWRVDHDGRTWPDDPWPDMRYRNAGVDPKYVWEVHRLLYLLPMAALAEQSADPAATRDMVRAVLDDWAGATRPNHGIAWASGIEVSLRLLALTVLASDETIRLSPATLSRIRAECSHGLHHLVTFPSLFSSANNHRVAELVALLVVGRAWGSSAERGEELELAQVADSLFGEDGAPLEQSSTYGAVTLELLGLARRFGDWRDDDAGRGIDAVLERGAACLAAFVEPSLGILRYGDDDEWRILGVGLSEESWLACLSTLFGHRLESDGPGLQQFADGGISVVRTDDGSVVTFDHGPLGFGALAAHGHADALHTSMYFDGLAWVVDPGTFEYHRSVVWRDYFRVADHHNGPRVESDPMCRPTGPFNWAARRPVTTLVESVVTPSGTRLTATTRSGAQPAHVTRRELKVVRGQMTVHDEGPADAVLISRFVFNPECRLERVDAASVLLTHPLSTATVLMQVTKGDLTLERDGAWVSTEYAVKHLADALTVRSAAPGGVLDLVLTWQRTPDQGVS